MNDFQRQLLALLDSAAIIRGEGKSILLFKKQFHNLPASLIVYMDTEAKELAQSHKFLYLPSFSGEDRLMFADVMYTVYEYANGIDVYGYEKTIEGTTRKITLATIKSRKHGGDKGDYFSLYNDLRNDIGPLFMNVGFNMSNKNLDELAHIEIGKIDKFYNAGIVVVKELNDTTVNANRLKALNYARKDPHSLGIITDGYEFLVLTEEPYIGAWYFVSMDYAHFVGRLIKKLRMVLD